MFNVYFLHLCNQYISRLLSEIEDILGDRKEVTGDDLDKLKYTEQVLSHFVSLLSPHGDMYVQVIQEVLRMYPTVPFITKGSPKGGVIMSGYHIPEDTPMSVSTGGLVRILCVYFMIYLPVSYIIDVQKS